MSPNPRDLFECVWIRRVLIYLDEFIEPFSVLSCQHSWVLRFHVLVCLSVRTCDYASLCLSLCLCVCVFVFPHGYGHRATLEGGILVAMEEARMVMEMRGRSSSLHLTSLCPRKPRHVALP